MQQTPAGEVGCCQVVRDQTNSCHPTAETNTHARQANTELVCGKYDETYHPRYVSG